ncbi:MAG: sigma-70 family RNA polymerase sigma factor [Deltaproteobacteria bacterium]|nr:sigma-70 family RNA polymerase sigma factor [Deltaproteobacteria bacterium]
MNQKPEPSTSAASYRDLSDLALRDAVLGHDALAWRELMRRFRPLIFRCIMKTAGRFDSVLGSEDIDEIFAEVCLNLVRDDMKKLRVYDPARGTKLSSWLGLISINTTYDHLRSIAREPILDRIDGCPEGPSGSPSPLDELLDRERWRRLAGLAADFSARDQRFVELYFASGLGPLEVARAMNISIKTVYSKKNKIRKRLLALAQSAATPALAA